MLVNFVLVLVDIDMKDIHSIGISLLFVVTVSQLIETLLKRYLIV